MSKEEKKFLFYYCGKEVYEGDETHQMLERCRIEFNGDHFAMAKYDLEEYKKQIEKIFK